MGSMIIPFFRIDRELARVAITATIVEYGNSLLTG
jgi:hypothetical protein